MQVLRRLEQSDKRWIPGSMREVDGPPCPAVPEGVHSLLHVGGRSPREEVDRHASKAVADTLLLLEVDILLDLAGEEGIPLPLAVEDNLQPLAAGEGSPQHLVVVEDSLRHQVVVACQGEVASDGCTANRIHQLARCISQLHF